MRKKSLFVLGLLSVGLIFASFYVWGQSNARRPAIIAGADRVVYLQRIDPSWEGTWYWYVGSTGNATNLTGVTALGLLEAYNDTKDPTYLNSAIKAAGFIMTHLGAGATGTKYHVRTTAPDIIFLHKLKEATGDDTYSIRAILEWNNIKSFYPTAEALDTYFRTIGRRSAWDMAFFLEAAYLSGDTAWANGAAAILANTSDTFYYGTDTWWYALNLAGAIRALVGCGYFGQHGDSVLSLLNSLVSLINDANGIDGYVQDTSYAVLALNSLGGAARAYANSLGRWLATTRAANGGWLEGGYEYPEVNGEAVRALACTIGSNITLDGFEPGAVRSSTWKRPDASMKAKPFEGNE